MEKYIVRVNGKEYEVEIEKTGSVSAKPKAEVREDVPQPAVKKPEQVGGTVLEAGAAGKVFRILKKQGEKIEKGEEAVIIEAMKMEIPMVTTVSGTINAIFVTEGQPVEAGDMLLRII